MNRREVIARACHSAWYAYTVLGLGEEGEPWDSAPEFQKESIRNAVAFWDQEMQPSPEGDLVPDDWARQALPELSHNNWMWHKSSEGWIYGEVKDAEAKTHPCMVAYDKLPEAQKIKDSVVIEAYLALRQLEQGHTTHCKTDDLIAGKEEPPLPLEVIPNEMGVNLCSVEGMSWTRQDDGQLVDVTIHFVPDLS